MKNENGKISITIGTLLGIIIVLLIIVGLLSYKLNANKTSTDISKENSYTERSNNLKENLNISNVIDNNSEERNNKITEDKFTENDISYEIEIKDEQNAKIIATINGETFEKDLKDTATILENCTGMMNLPILGNVALVTESGGEYCGVNVYQLVENEIKLIGTIDCGAGMNNEVNYEFNQTDETTVLVEAELNNKSNKKEIQMSAAIDKIEKIKLFDLGEILLISETGGEYYGIKAYRANYDYITGEYDDIIEVGTLTPIE